MQVGFSVCLTRHALPGGGYLAQLSLNAPQRLNALTPEMVEMLQRHLRVLQQDAEALGVFLEGEGDRAFCVGADARRMLESALANPGGSAVEAEAFMATEYTVAHLIHRFTKPVICWGHGLVMGSGLGILAGSSHRIVTANSALSLPETLIGLIPNAGAAWYLRQMPGETGLFSAITAAQLSAADALYSGLADYCFADSHRSEVLQQLLELHWSEDPESNHAMLTEFLTESEIECGLAIGSSPLKEHRDWIDKACASKALPVIAKAIEGAEGRSSWLCEATDGFRRGAASSKCLVAQILHRSRDMKLADVFRMELVVMANRIRDPEFAEGVRARLLDRDRDPRWCYRDVEEVPDSEIEAFFISPWERHPLVDL